MAAARAAGDVSRNMVRLSVTVLSWLGAIGIITSGSRSSPGWPRAVITGAASGAPDRATADDHAECVARGAAAATSHYTTVSCGARTALTGSVSIGPVIS